MKTRVAALFFAAYLPGLLIAQASSLTILHTNDLHSHIEPTRVGGKFLGGYSRQATLVNQLRQVEKNVLLLNAGDTFQGTIYFNTYEGLSDVVFMNYLRYDAAAVGNHEFDRGPEVFSKFIKAATFPVLAANLDVESEPLLRDLVKPTAIVTVGGEKIGLVGAVTSDLPTISNIGPNVKMLDLRESCQRAIDSLTSQGITKVILITHVGYGEEVALTKSLKGIDVLVGGHSHTYLCNLQVEGLPSPSGPYPTEVSNADGDKALVVQAWQWGMVLGKITVDFDDKGRVTGFRGAAPIIVTEDVPEDPVMKSIVAAFSKPVDSVKNRVIGRTETPLVRDRAAQSMAMVIADAQLEATAKFGSVVAFVNAGGVRAALEAGDVTYGDALTVQPFNNSLTVMELTGAELLAALVHGVKNGGGQLFPSRGTSYVVKGGEVSDVVVAGSPLDLSKTYLVAVNAFTAGGGDAHTALHFAKGKRVETGLVDIDALLDYFKNHSPIKMDEKPRIKYSDSVPLAKAG